MQLRLGGESISITAPTERECARQAALVKAEHLVHQRQHVAKSDLTLKEVCERYIARKETALRSPETIRGYSVILQNRFQSAMQQRVTSIKNWQELYNADAAHLSPKTMANTWSFIKSACKSELGLHLPELETVSPDHKEHAFLTAEEIQKFIAASAGDKQRIALLLGLHSCRSSEILAIDWSNVDFVNDRIRIQGALVHDKKNQKVEKKKNKTAESTRYIPIMIPELREELAAVKDKTGKVVVAGNNTLTRHANRVCVKAGIPEVGLHGLRHSFASLCYSLDVPMKITMQIGGWKDPKICSDIYTHLSQKDVTNHVDQLRDFFKKEAENAN